MVENVSWLAMLQCALAMYKSNLVIDRYNQMPERCTKYGMAREVLARAYLEKLDYAKAVEILEEVHREFPHRVSGMEVCCRTIKRSGISRQMLFLCRGQ